MSETTVPTGPANVADVEEAMRDVVDPELGINVVDLGLVYGISYDDTSGMCTIDMTLTSALPVDRRDRGPDRLRAQRLREGLPDQLGLDAAVGPDKITDEGREQLRALGFNV
jgi:metal-sulfur cluster biosynthetic enzyme